MLFDVYGDTAVFQWVGWIIVFVGLILMNEFARRTKAGGIICFLVISRHPDGLLHRHQHQRRIGARSGRWTTPPIPI